MNFAVSECRGSRSVSENERCENRDCCLCPRGLRVCCICCSFCGRLRTTCSFLLVTPNTSPNQHIYFSGPQWWCQLLRLGSEVTEVIKEWEGDQGTPRPRSHLHRVEITFPFYYTNGKSVHKNQIPFFRWKSRAGCLSPLWGPTTCSHYLHWPLCARSLSVQGWWDTWRWASKSQSNCRSQTTQ